MASDTGTLYIGVTNNLHRRVLEHQQGLVEGFTKKYKCNKLVYFEHTTDVNSAIMREKEIKKWRREKKINLIKKDNPGWRDISDELGIV
jgi:putative endonuclease